uniref:Uncharacterized protein n=1 Tax=viral metagenome TaxID=1070528 RepID=A0A6M3LMC4_9ZZZZ
MADPITAAVIISAVSTTASSVSAQNTAAKSARSAREAQEDAMRKAEQDLLAAEGEKSLAEQQAEQKSQDNIRKKRFAQTQTILTSPLGLLTAPNTKQKTLLGG